MKMAPVPAWTGRQKGLIFPMAARLPSLNGLRAFEAAARHMSFTQAAAELNVTQTAISHLIRRLEQEIGVNCSCGRTAGSR